MLESPVATDHRPRVAAERRARMRRKLVESALLVFAEKGVDASVIEDVIAAAGVSRGTFYNYFRTNAELLVAAIRGARQRSGRPRRVAREGVSLAGGATVHGLAPLHGHGAPLPLFARFIARVGPQAIGPDDLVYQVHPDPHCGGDRGGRVRRRATLGSRWTWWSAPASLPLRVFPPAVRTTPISSAMLLALARSLGLDPVRAETLLSEPVEPLDLSADSLLVRSDARAKKKKRQKRR